MAEMHAIPVTLAAALIFPAVQFVQNVLQVSVVLVLASKDEVHGEHEIVNNAAPEIFIRTRGRRGHNDSKYYGALFNLFGSTGVFDSILRRLNGQKGKQKGDSQLLEVLQKEE